MMHIYSTIPKRCLIKAWRRWHMVCKARAVNWRDSIEGFFCYLFMNRQNTSCNGNDDTWDEDYETN